jgi:hypothetical protein
MGLHGHGESKFEEEHCLDLAVQVYLNEFFPNSSGDMMTKGSSEPAATAPVQDEAVQVIFGMNPNTPK